MSDPLKSPSPGDVSPFVTNHGTVSTALDILRRGRDNLRGPAGGAGATTPFRNVQWVYAENLLDTDLDSFRPVFLNPGFPTLADTGTPWTEDEIFGVLGSFTVYAQEPAGSSMSGSTSILGVSMEPVPSGSVGRFAVQGIWACYVSFAGSEQQGWADTTALNNDYLTSRVGSGGSTGGYGCAAVIARGGTSAGTEIAIIGLGCGSFSYAELTTTQVFKNGAGTNSTMTIQSGLITGIV